MTIAERTKAGFPMEQAQTDTMVKYASPQRNRLRISQCEHFTWQADILLQRGNL